mmetsp:Transcript_34012/g.87948  ORF Transcript_34012/g.87948 Transcript_34012/m.87948 type:complete len:349 (-) Transcript_34012:87-1133(-)
MAAFRETPLARGRMAGDCCFQGRPPLERLRNLCVGCLVLDSLFVLLYGLSALGSARSKDKYACYEEHGYFWYNVVNLAFAVSSVVAVGGATVHGIISCAASIQVQQLANVSRFAHVLVCWTFIQALLEAVAYRQEPLECADTAETQGTSSEQGPTGEDGGQLVWQVAYTILWLSWVTGAVASAVLARRCAVLLPELNAAAASIAAAQIGWPTAQAQQAGATPQTLGVPVHFPMATMGVPQLEGASGAMPGGPCGPAHGAIALGDIAPGAIAAGAIAPGAAAGGEPSQGASWGPAAADPWQTGDAAAAAPWQGSTIVTAGGAVVAQGMPVAGSSPPDPEKGGGGTAKAL